MHHRSTGTRRPGAPLALMVAIGVSAGPAVAQDRLKGMPGYERYEARGKGIEDSVKSGALSVAWLDGGKAFVYRKDGKVYRYDLAARKAEEAAPGTQAPPPPGRRTGRGGGPGRGQQLESALSPDRTLRAFYRDRNLWVGDPGGLIEVAVTSDGNARDRTRNGKASWVYGEELGQDTAFWWSPDGKKLAYYRFDEGKVADYYLAIDQAQVQDRLEAEAYPKAGAPNPIVDLFLYDLKAKKAIKVDVRDGRAAEDEGVGHYAYRVAWSADGRALLFHRTNRLQNVVELAAADPETGKCRVVVREEWPASWVENNPETRFLGDGRRFLRANVRNGWKNYDLHDLDGRRLAAVTANEFDADRIVRVDEKAGVLDYLARDGDTPMKPQLHRVRLDGTGDRRLTDPALHHAVHVAPDGEHVVDVAQSHDVPPSTRLLDADGKVLEVLADSDLGKFDALGLRRAELLRFKSADGAADLFGTLQKPSDFDPTRSYPLLVFVYAGPESSDIRGTFVTPSPLTELGFLVASFESRGGSGRGKRAMDAIYRKLGQGEIDDQAAGVRSLRDRPYVDASRVGIYGTSYGGYASILAPIRHPDAFRAACASSPVTDFRHYDTIYTERYLRTPAKNKEGYDAGSAVVHADELKGRLMLYYGTADNNVHPSNSLQLIRALQRAGKGVDVQVGPDAGHSAIGRERMMEFFIEALGPGPGKPGPSSRPTAAH